ncbi:MAG TPA: SulP family inorganic anion transporter [Casimicrobiaceae bacterium]|nr:SulP family inorganic anion transporter [Casimicrobiaceae bacterium]
MAFSLRPAPWIAGYQPASLPRDAVAGVTLAAYAIPVSLAYATLAGLPPQHGVYCYLVGGLAYALFGTSRQLAIGPTSAISMLVGASIAGMATDAAGQAVAIAALVALQAAVVCFAAWALRLSSLVNFISETVLTGFKAGAALTIAMTQLPKLFGVAGGGEGFFERASTLVAQLPQTNATVLGFGLAAIALLVAGERFLPSRPVALAVVAASIVLLTFTPLASSGFRTVGILPEGLPALAWPSRSADVFEGVETLAVACFLLAYIEGVSAARAIARRHGDAIDPRRELLALGAANLAASAFQGYPVAGGLSQSSVNDKAGARSPLALVFASIAIALFLAFLTGLLKNLPDVVLAAIVLVAVKGLFDVRALRTILALDRTEFAIAMFALIGVLFLGILKGVLLAAIVSMLMLVRAAAHPHVARLGRVPGTRRYSDADRHPDNETLPGALAVRTEASILYFNADHVRERVLDLLSGSDGVRALVLDLSSSPHVDIAGARMIADLARDLAARGITTRIVDARASVRERLRLVAGWNLGEIDRRLSLDDVVSAGGDAPVSTPRE